MSERTEGPCRGESRWRLLVCDAEVPLRVAVAVGNALGGPPMGVTRAGSPSGGGEWRGCGCGWILADASNWNLLTSPGLAICYNRESDANAVRRHVLPT